MKRTIKTNASNWSGENTTATLNTVGDDLILEHNGYSYRVVEHPVTAKDCFGGFFKIELFMEKETECPIVVVSKFGEDAAWEAFDGKIREGALSRSSECPYKAAVKVLSNIV